MDVFHVFKIVQMVLNSVKRLITFVVRISSYLLVKSISVYMFNAIDLLVYCAVPAGINLLNVSNRNTVTRCEICSQ